MLGKAFDRLSPILAPTIQWLLGRERNRRLHALRRVAPLIVPGYLVKEPVDWWSDQEFHAYLEKFGELRLLNADRRWNLSQLLALTKDVPGDIAECGVFTGSAAYVMCREFEKMGQRRSYHGFDSFEGLSIPDDVDGSHWVPGDLSSPEETAIRNLEGFDVTLHKGWIPERFDDVSSRSFAVVHIDVDLEQPTRDSIAFFYPRTHPGGLIVIDDYGAATCPGATAAVNTFMATRPEPVISLASGGAFIIKA